MFFFSSLLNVDRSSGSRVNVLVPLREEDESLFQTDRALTGRVHAWPRQHCRFSFNQTLSSFSMRVMNIRGTPALLVVLVACLCLNVVEGNFQLRDFVESSMRNQPTKVCMTCWMLVSHIMCDRNVCTMPREDRETWRMWVCVHKWG